MAAVDADANADAVPRLSAHQYNQLIHLLAAADRSSFHSPPTIDTRRVFAHMLQAVDEAFELVATMKDKYGLSPRLRSYGPVLTAFRRAGE
jgi:proteinaceous RNase P